MMAPQQMQQLLSPNQLHALIQQKQQALLLQQVTTQESRYNVTEPSKTELWSICIYLALFSDSWWCVADCQTNHPLNYCGMCSWAVLWLISFPCRSLALTLCRFILTPAGYSSPASVFCFGFSRLHLSSVSLFVSRRSDPWGCSVFIQLLYYQFNTSCVDP